MTSLAQVGVLYVYLMLVILIIGLGLMALRSVEGLMKFIKAGKSPNNNGKKEYPWVNLAFISSSVLFLSIFSLGILKTIGAGEQGDHNHGNQSASTSNNSTQVLRIQQQLDFFNYQLFQLEKAINTTNGSYRYPY